MNDGLTPNACSYAQNKKSETFLNVKMTKMYLCMLLELYRQAFLFHALISREIACLLKKATAAVLLDPTVCFLLGWRGACYTTRVAHEAILFKNIFIVGFWKIKNFCKFSRKNLGKRFTSPGINPSNLLAEIIKSLGATIVKNLDSIIEISLNSTVLTFWGKTTKFGNLGAACWGRTFHGILNWGSSPRSMDN